MKLRNHFRIFGIVTFAWTLFLLIGLPGYYQQYSFHFMLLFDILLLIPLSLLIYWILKNTPRNHRMRFSLWLAFYISIPLFLYDYFYCALYLGHGWSFLSGFWYLSVYYVIPWIVCPAISFWLNRHESQNHATEIGC